MTATPKYLVHEQTGQVYPWTEQLAKRRDMKPTNTAPAPVAPTYSAFAMAEGTPIPTATSSADHTELLHKVASLERELTNSQALAKSLQAQVDDLMLALQDRAQAEAKPAAQTPAPLVLPPAGNTRLDGRSKQARSQRTMPARAPLTTPAELDAALDAGLGGETYVD